jgi:RNA polymerase sigma-70 factor (ECF subfamily)
MGASPSGHLTAVANRAAGGKRLDPEVLGVHLDRLFRLAWALCGSRENAEDLVQDTFARILARPRFLRREDELAYLMQAVRNTFLSNRRMAARRPNVVTTLDDVTAADRRTATRPEEAVMAAQVFSVIAELPEPFRSTLAAVDVAGLSYREAARALGANEATITTRLYRARRRVARELAPDRFDAGQARRTGEASARQAWDDASASDTTVPIDSMTPPPNQLTGVPANSPNRRARHSALDQD